MTLFHAWLVLAALAALFALYAGGILLSEAVKDSDKRSSANSSVYAERPDEKVASSGALQPHELARGYRTIGRVEGYILGRYDQRREEKRNPKAKGRTL